MDNKEDNSALVNADGSWNKDGIELEILNKFTNANLFIKQDVFDMIKASDAPLRMTDCFLDYIFHDVFPKKAVTTLDMGLFVDFLSDYAKSGGRVAVTNRNDFKLDFKSQKYCPFVEPNDDHVKELEAVCNKILEDRSKEELERCLAGILQSLHLQTIKAVGLRSKHIYDVPWETLPKKIVRHDAGHGKYTGWRDHMSVEYRKVDGEALRLVTQPYNLTKEDVLDLIDVTEHFGTDFKIDAQYSAHFPGRTFRVSIPLPYYKLPKEMRGDVR